MADDIQVAAPQTTTQQPPPTALKYYKTQGTDGKWYSTQAASPQEAQQKLAKFKQPQQRATGAGSGDPNSDTKMLSKVDRRPTGPPKNYGFTLENVGKNYVQGVNAAAKGTYEVGKDLASNPNWFTGKDSTAQKFVYGPADEQMAKAKEDYRNNRLLEAAGHALASVVPIFGPIAANLGEQAGKGDVGGATGQAAGMWAFGKTSKIAADEVTGLAKPEALRTRAAELNTKVLKQAESGSRDYKTSSGLQVAQEQIVAGARELPNKIEQVRAAKNAEVVQRAQAADKAGTVIDITQDIKPIVQEVAQLSNARGQWTPQLRNQIRSLLERVTTQTDLKTGQRIPRDLSKLSVTQALQLEKGLEDLSAFGRDTPTAINNTARRLRGAMNDKLPQEIKQLRTEESRLITARDAARKNWEQILNDKSAAGRGVLYKGAGPVAVYFGLKAIGLGGLSAPFLGTVVLYKALASTPSRTLRAALYARAADMLDGATRASAGPTAAAGGSSAMQGPLGPKPGQLPVNKALTGQTAPPFASATVVSTNPPAAQPVRGTQLPASAMRARAGSGDYVKEAKSKVAQTQADLNAKFKDVVKTSQVEMRQKAEAAKTSVAVSNTKNKAMLDRLDTLLERQAKPKSAMDNAAIQREVTEIKKLLSGEAVPGATKRIADRERLASKRAQAAATSTPQTIGAQGEPIAQTSSPEFRAIALDAGYKALLKYEGGSEMAKALKSTAKAMQKIDPSYDEVEKLTEALEILKQVSNMPQ